MFVFGYYGGGAVDTRFLTIFIFINLLQAVVNLRLCWRVEVEGKYTPSFFFCNLLFSSKKPFEGTCGLQHS